MKRTMKQLQHVPKIRLATSCRSDEITTSFLRVYHDDDDDDDDSDDIFVVVN